LIVSRARALIQTNFINLAPEEEEQVCEGGGLKDNEGEASRGNLRASGLYAIFLACGRLIDYYGVLNEISIVRFVAQKLPSIPIADIVQKVLTDEPEIMSQSTLTFLDIQKYM
jgi:hypothetical protein